MEVLCDEVETVKGFCYLGDRLNASGGCETAVTARVRIGWMKFRECRELLLGRFSLKMKGMVYRSCVRSAILCHRIIISGEALRFRSKQFKQNLPRNCSKSAKMATAACKFSKFSGGACPRTPRAFFIVNILQNNSSRKKNV